MNQWEQYGILVFATIGASWVLLQLARAAQVWFYGICQYALKETVRTLQRQVDRNNAELASFRYQIEALTREMKK